MDINGTKINTEVVFGVGKAVLFGEVSSFHGSAIEGFHCIYNLSLKMYECPLLILRTESFGKKLSCVSVTALSRISDQYEVAFGGFADKRAIPYAFPNQDPRTYHNLAT